MCFGITHDILQTGQESCVRFDVLRFIHVGLLCVQECSEDRPAMSYVLLVPIVIKEEATLPQPKHTAFSIQREPYDSSRALRTTTATTKSAVIITILEAA
ncbi:hypothetical protein HRI_000525400 [Hibiscus trionum]|uniref:S-locus receptor kinase C-terminal domain-containing protein n=1 Tax=Hibiscus trionum TaxID=183268 RepID=A0A9W7H2D2_HIBTR|nr:hypothetical protein HRI_000525400 [Hibiscus trionum]